MYDFSLILNSRGRVNQLSRFLDLVYTKTKFKDNIEILVYVDIDDDPTVNYLKQYSLSTILNITSIIGPRPTSLNGSINKMAKDATGKYIFVLNDDAEIMTQDWDEIVLKNISNFKLENNIKDNIIYGLTLDTSVDKPQGKEYASFPIISKESVETLGFFMDERFVGLGGDSAIYRVYKAVNRVVELKDLVIDHIYHNAIFKVISPDKTAYEMRLNSQNNPLDPFTIDINNDVKKLQEHILKFNE